MPERLGNVNSNDPWYGSAVTRTSLTYLGHARTLMGYKKAVDSGAIPWQEPGATALGEVVVDMKG